MSDIISKALKSKELWSFLPANNHEGSGIINKTGNFSVLSKGQSLYLESLLASSKESETAESIWNETGELLEDVRSDLENTFDKFLRPEQQSTGILVKYLGSFSFESLAGTFNLSFIGVPFICMIILMALFAGYAGFDKLFPELWNLSFIAFALYAYLFNLIISLLSTALVLLFNPTSGILRRVNLYFSLGIIKFKLNPAVHLSIGLEQRLSLLAFGYFFDALLVMLSIFFDINNPYFLTLIWVAHLRLLLGLIPFSGNSLNDFLKAELSSKKPFINILSFLKTGLVNAILGKEEIKYSEKVILSVVAVSVVIFSDFLNFISAFFSFLNSAYFSSMDTSASFLALFAILIFPLFAIIGSLIIALSNLFSGMVNSNAALDERSILFNVVSIFSFVYLVIYFFAGSQASKTIAALGFVVLILVNLFFKIPRSVSREGDWALLLYDFTYLLLFLQENPSAYFYYAVIFGALISLFSVTGSRRVLVFINLIITSTMLLTTNLDFIDPAILAGLIFALSSSRLFAQFFFHKSLFNLFSALDLGAEKELTTKSYVKLIIWNARDFFNKNFALFFRAFPDFTKLDASLEKASDNEKLSKVLKEFYTLLESAFKSPWPGTKHEYEKRMFIEIARNMHMAFPSSYRKLAETNSLSPDFFGVEGKNYPNRDFLESVLIFKDLQTEQKEKLANSFRYQSVYKDEVLIRQGERGADFFILIEGQLEVSTTDQEGQTLKIATLTEGDYFGELALMGDGYRKATVSASRQCEVWSIGKGLFDELILGNQSVNDALKAHSLQLTLQSLPLFSRIPIGSLAELVSKMEQKEFKAHEKLIKQGEKGSKYFIILNGRVGVYKDEIKLAELSNGEGFGEISLLMGIPTTSSVETLSDSTLLMLERDDFKSFVEKNASVEKRISKLIRNRLDQLGALNDIEASK